MPVGRLWPFIHLFVCVCYVKFMTIIFHCNSLFVELCAIEHCCTLRQTEHIHISSFNDGIFWPGNFSAACQNVREKMQAHTLYVRDRIVAGWGLFFPRFEGHTMFSHELKRFFFLLLAAAATFFIGSNWTSAGENRANTLSSHWLK